MRKHINNNGYKHFVLSLALALACSAAASAWSTEMIEEVVVTAQKRTQSVNDVGLTINTFSGDQLQDFGVVTAEDMAMMTPGLTVNETAATGVPLYTIRGVGFQDYSTAASSTVGIYFDEVAMPYTVMTRGMVFDTERVEVLKGPQGDLYGRNTTAGQINFISQKPTPVFDAGITGSYSTYETIDVEGFVSGPLGDAMRGRLALKTVQSREGWQESTIRNDELGEKDATALRGILNVDLGATASLMLIARYGKDESENTANTPYNGLDENLGSEFANPYIPLDEYILPTGSNFGEEPPWYSTGDSEAADWTNRYTSPVTGITYDLRPQRDNEMIGLTARVDWNFSGMSLTSVTGYNEFEREETNDWDGGFYNDSSNINTTDLEVFSQELRLSGDTGKMNWIAGLYYSYDEMNEFYKYFMSDSVFGFGSIPFGAAPFNVTPVLQLDTKYDQETESAAVFGHVEYQFTERWRLTLGARYTEEEREWNGCTFIAEDGTLADFLSANFGANLAMGDCGTINDNPDSPNYIFNVIGTPNVNDAFQPFSDTIKTEKWMGKIGLDYVVNNDILLYGTISQGFKSGGFNGANSNTTQQLEPYEEEVLTSYEIGSKATVLEGSMQLNAAAFYYDYEDKQEQDVAVTFVGNIAGLTNVPESRIYGAEMDMQWLPTRGLSINLGVSWLDSEVKEWNAVNQEVSAWPNTVTRDVSGIELAMTPEWSYNAMVKYEWPISDALLMEVGGDLSFTDDTTGGINPENATDSYTVANARIGVGSSDGRWRVLLWSRNITDKEYFTAAYQGGNGPFVRNYAMPRTVGVTLSYFAP